MELLNQALDRSSIQGKLEHSGGSLFGSNAQRLEDLRHAFQLLLGCAKVFAPGVGVSRFQAQESDFLDQ